MKAVDDEPISIPEPRRFAGFPITLPSPCFLEGIAAQADIIPGDIEWFSLPGGTILFESGAPADSLYLLLTGALAVMSGRPHDAMVAQIRPGETVGEMGVISGRPRIATVVSIRDSSLLRIDRTALAHLLRLDPGASLRLVGQLVDWLDQTTQGRRQSFVPRTLACLAISPAIPIEAVARHLAAAIATMGVRVATLDAGALHNPAEYFHAIEHAHDLTIYGAAAEGAWTSLALRRADHVLLVADACAPPPERLPEVERSAALPWRLTELVLLHLDGKPPRATSRWLGRYGIRNHYHIRWPDDGDMGRLGRYVAGRAVALVLSGGGARGFGHVGVIRALREAAIPIDMVCGTSIGAIVAAGVALGWSDAEFDRRMRAAFVQSNPLNDYTIPLVALTRGRKVAARLEQHFGECRIEDLWLPYFCLASNLTTGAEFVFREGTLWRALRTSIAIPGLLPPTILGNEVLADGALLNNLPADVMATMARGPIVGVDVTRYRTLTIDPARRRRLQRRLHSGYDGPGIASILISAANLSSDAQTRLTRSHVDVLLEPPLATLDMRDWRAYDRAIEAGYRYAKQRLPELEQAVRRIRRAAGAV
jgi:NTE family protein